MYPAPRSATHPLQHYRPDIDGLRAVAVIAVMAFHAFPSALPGGFIGVDVFFVISGYLISGIILRSLAAGTFSFREFYYRRARRIFPALAVVLGSVYLLGWLVLLPPEFKHLGSQIVAGGLFLANFKYWQEAGYFDAAAETKPLLHLWSLGVEEQFYLLWPLLLWAAWRLRFRFGGVVLWVAAVSFAVNIAWVWSGSLPAAFYSPASRFWELMLGALVACSADRLVWSPWARTVAAWAGAGAIAAALVLLSPSSAFPGFWALLPTVGTALLIAAGPQAWPNRTLLQRPALVGIGLISYPLYLWHWPLLSLARVTEGAVPDVDVRVAILALSVVLAWATYRMVERPIRFGAAASFRTFAALAACLAVVAVGGLAARLGSPAALSSGMIANAGEVAGSEDGNAVFFAEVLSGSFPCTPEHIRAQADRQFWPARCVQSRETDRKDIAIVGDSHAEDLYIGLSERLPGRNVVTYIKAGLPVRSTAQFRDIFDHVASDANIRSVIIGSYWRFHRVPQGSSLEAEIEQTVRQLTSRGKSVVLLGARPDFPFSAPACKYRRVRLFWQRHDTPRCDFERPAFDAQRAAYDQVLAQVAQRVAGVRVVNVADAFCGPDSCQMAQAGSLLFRDENHLTIAGSRILAQQVAAVLEP